MVALWQLSLPCSKSSRLESRVLSVGPAWSPAGTGQCGWAAGPGKEQQQSPSSSRVYPGPSSLPDRARAPAVPGTPQEGFLSPWAARLPQPGLSGPASIPLPLRHQGHSTGSHSNPQRRNALLLPEDAIPCTKKIL